MSISRPILVCVRRGMWLAALFAIGLGCLEAYLRWEVHAAAKNAPELGPVDTFDEADLTREVFYRDYVLKRRPVKIRLAKPDIFNSTQLLERCGNTSRVRLISGATAQVLQGILKSWLKYAFDWVVLPLLGKWTTLEKEIRSRAKMPLLDYMAHAEGPSLGGNPQEFTLPLPLFLLRVLPTRLVVLFDVFARPLYLHGQPLEDVCPDALAWYHVPQLLLPTWFYTGSLASYVPESKEQKLDGEPRLFMGQAQTMSYPMHRNNERHLDFTMVVMQGRKRYAIFLEDQHENLNPFNIAGSRLYAINAFWPDLVQTPRFSEAVGWKGTLEAGEMLFSPSNSIHCFENFDFDRQTVAIQYWSLSHTQACGVNSTDEADCAARLGIDMPDSARGAPTIFDYRAQGKSERKRVESLTGLTP